jgi:hypothetical protein
METLARDFLAIVVPLFFLACGFEFGDYYASQKCATIPSVRSSSSLQKGEQENRRPSERCEAIRKRHAPVTT